MAELRTVKRFEIVGKYTLAIGFDDGKRVVIDFEPILAGELFGPLLYKGLFNQVRIDPEVKTLVWPNGADFDPNTLHDWDQQKAHLIKEAAKWELAGLSNLLKAVDRESKVSRETVLAKLKG